MSSWRNNLSPLSPTPFRYTGEMGVISAVPLIAFFGFGVLNKDDFNGFFWNVVMLAQGGLAVGECRGEEDG